VPPVNLPGGVVDTLVDRPDEEELVIDERLFFEEMLRAMMNRKSRWFSGTQQNRGLPY
jgi:hypothetical protein